MEKDHVKKALILTYYWPPSGGAGVQRWLKFVKYLRNEQWEPVLYVPENPEYPELDVSLEKDVPSGITVLKTPVWEPYHLYKKLMGRKKEERIQAAFLSEQKQNPWLQHIAVWIRGNFFIPDARRFWIKPSIRFLTSYLKEHPVDVIVSTGPPHSLHLIARQVSRQLHIPWLADFRDPWTNIDFYQELKLTKPADAKHHRLEKSVLRDADAVTVISRSMGADFHRIVPRTYDVITNGFDPDDIREEEPVHLDRNFSIAHIGTLVQSRNPVALWEVLARLTKTNPEFAADLEIKLIGNIDLTVTDSINRFNLSPYVKRIPYLPHDQVVNCQRSAQILLLIINNTPNARLILTGKFFEYLAAKRPVLCLGPADGDAALILKETGAGVLVEHHDLVGIESAMLNYYKAFKTGSLKIEGKNLEAYSRKNLTKQLAEILNRIC